MLLKTYPIKTRSLLDKSTTIFQRFRRAPDEKIKFTTQLEEAKKVFKVGTAVKDKDNRIGKVAYIEELHLNCYKDLVNDSWRFLLVEWEKPMILVRTYLSPFELEIIHDTEHVPS